MDSLNAHACRAGIQRQLQSGSRLFGTSGGLLFLFLFFLAAHAGARRQSLNVPIYSSLEASILSKYSSTQNRQKFKHGVATNCQSLCACVQHCIRHRRAIVGEQCVRINRTHPNGPLEPGKHSLTNSLTNFPPPFFSSLASLANLFFFFNLFVYFSATVKH